LTLFVTLRLVSLQASLKQAENPCCTAGHWLVVGGNCATRPAARVGTEM